MKEVITTEMKKAFRSKGFLVAALSGVLLAVIQTIWAYQNIYQVNMKERNHILGLPVTDEHYGSWFQTCIMQGWIGCEYYSSFNQFLFFHCHFCRCYHTVFPCIRNGNPGMQCRCLSGGEESSISQVRLWQFF